MNPLSQARQEPVDCEVIAGSDWWMFRGPVQASLLAAVLVAIPAWLSRGVQTALVFAAIPIGIMLLACLLARSIRRPGYLVIGEDRIKTLDYDWRVAWELLYSNIADIRLVRSMWGRLGPKQIAITCVETQASQERVRARHGYDWVLDEYAVPAEVLVEKIQAATKGGRTKH